jgi:hypothetical protein
MMKLIRLELARTPAFPEGSRQHGYEFTAPLDAEGHLDVEAWRQGRKRCTVRRFWAGEDDQFGQLVHTRHRTWAFSYAPGEDDDEPIYRLEGHVFTPDAYVSITEHDGVTRPFKVAGITTLK